MFGKDKKRPTEDTTVYLRVDEDHNTFRCMRCGALESFEADGPYENGWDVCPHCGRRIKGSVSM